MRIILWDVLGVFLSIGSIAQERYKSFEIKNGDFLANGKPVQIFSGEMHYARIPKEYWRMK